MYSKEYTTTRTLTQYGSTMLSRFELPSSKRKSIFPSSHRTLISMTLLKTLSFASLLFARTIFCQPEIHYGSNPDAGHYTIVNDITLYYEEYGSGHPLLLMHGNAGSIASFSKLIPFLANHYRVIAVDTRAQGRSGDSDKELTFKLVASDFKMLLDQLQLDSVYAFGWSDGGIAGLQMAYAYPGLISKLAISGANFTADSNAMSPDEFDTTKITWFNELDSASQRAVMESSHFPNRAGIIFDKLINLDLKYPNFTIRQLGTIQTPTLVVAGDHDIIKVTHTVKLFHSLPHSELFIVPHSHHSVPIEHPELLSKVLIEFFDTPFKDIK